MSAADRYFVDTNVLLYSLDPSNSIKRQRAADWLEVLWQNGAARISWQVLHELYVNATRKIGRSTSETRAAVEVFSAWRPVDSSSELIRRAWHWVDAAHVSYWDALIVAAAEKTGCAWLLTEDLQGGRQFGPIKVLNPFQTRPEEHLPPV